MGDDVRREQIEVSEPVGSVTIYLHPITVCSADWGGWLWMAHGRDEDHARENLTQRLEHLDPFFGGPDHGPYGFVTDTEHYRPVSEALDDLDPRIPEPVRRRLRRYAEAVEERWLRDYPGA